MDEKINVGVYKVVTLSGLETVVLDRVFKKFEIIDLPTLGYFNNKKNSKEFKKLEEIQLASYCMQKVALE